MVVVSLATFLWGLAAWYHPPTLYTGRARVMYNGPLVPSGPDGKSHSIGRITADSRLRGLVGGAVPPAGTQHRDNRPVKPTVAIGRLRERITVRTAPAQRTDKRRVEIQFTDGDPRRAVALVDRLARQFIEDVQSTASVEKQAHASRRRQIEAQLAEAQGRVSDLKLALNAYVDGQLRQLQKDGALEQLPTRAPQGPPEQASDATTSETASPPTAGGAVSGDLAGLPAATPSASGNRLELLSSYPLFLRISPPVRAVHDRATTVC